MGELRSIMTCLLLSGGLQAQDGPDFDYRILTLSFEQVRDNYDLDGGNDFRVKLPFFNGTWYSISDQSMLYFESNYLWKIPGQKYDFKPTNLDTVFANHFEIFRAGWSNFVWDYSIGGFGINGDFNWGGHYSSKLQKASTAFGIADPIATAAGFGLGLGVSNYIQPIELITWQATLGYYWQFDARNAPKQTVTKGVYVDSHVLIKPGSQELLMLHLYNNFELLNFVDRKVAADDFPGKLTSFSFRIGLGINFRTLRG